MKAKEIQFVEKLLRGYKPTTAERIALNVQWNILERQKSQAIEGEFLGATTINDMPGTPYCGYKTPRLMIAKCEEITDIENEQSFILTRLKDIDDILTVLDSALLSLDNRSKDIICKYYIDNNSIEKIAHDIYLHPSNVKERKSKAIQHLYQSLKCLEGTIIFKSV